MYDQDLRLLSMWYTMSARFMVDMRWDTSRMVLSAFACCSDFRIMPSVSASRFEVGSSSSQKSLSARKVRAMPIRCRSPPERVSPSSNTWVS